jgi:putative SOS response-associated peptidase YedK
MCGRYNLTLSVEALARVFGFAERPNLAPRYNIAPTQEAPVVRRRDAGQRAGALAKGSQYELLFMRWGLVPAWSKAIGARRPLINARSDSVAEKPSFRSAFRHRRCLVPATGYYEWRSDPSGKQPFHIAPADGGWVAFAGLWESWKDPAKPDAAALLSFALMTTEPTAELSAIHDRMPVILAPADYDTWLAPESRVEQLMALLRPYAGAPLQAHPISRRVNAVRHDGPDILAPLDDPAPRLL